MEDLKNVFAGAVLMDTAAFQLLAERFPQLTFPGKVKLQSANGGSRADGKNEAYECFEGNRFVSDFRTVLFPQTPDVRTYSSFTHEPEGAGICTIPTEFGGNVVLCQYLNGLMWNGYRRKTILNALDSVIPGGMVVRLMTNGLALDVLARKDDRTGKTAGAFLLNLSIGETPDLELAIRNPAFDEYELLLPKQEPVKLIPVSDSGEEKRFIIPGLTAWQPALIRGKTQI